MSVGGAVLIGIVPALGHHAPQGEFDLFKKVMVKGTVKKMEWINPHPSILLDVKDEKTGQIKTWQFEVDGISTLRRAGVGRAILKYGLPVTVEFYPSWNGADHGFVQRLIMEDGKEYQVYFGEAEQQVVTPTR
jgi:hypothetical protein